MVTDMLTQAAILMGGAIVVVLLLRLLLRRAMGTRAAPGNVVDAVMEPLAGVYGLLLAFLIGGVADRAVELRAALRDEAEAFHRVDQIALRLPAPLGAQLRQSLHLYGRAEAAARQGRPVAAQASALLNDMWLAVAVFEPSRARDGVLQTEALGELDVLRAQRGAAARAAHSENSALIWLVLGVGSVGVIGVCVLAGLGDPRAPFYLAVLTAVITVALYSLYALSRPLLDLPFEALPD